MARTIRRTRLFVPTLALVATTTVALSSGCSSECATCKFIPRPDRDLTRAFMPHLYSAPNASTTASSSSTTATTTAPAAASGASDAGTSSGSTSTPSAASAPTADTAPPSAPHG